MTNVTTPITGGTGSISADRAGGNDGREQVPSRRTRAVIAAAESEHCHN
jgi:hypothetical protein